MMLAASDIIRRGLIGELLDMNGQRIKFVGDKQANELGDRIDSDEEREEEKGKVTTSEEEAETSQDDLVVPLNYANNTTRYNGKMRPLIIRP